MRCAHCASPLPSGGEFCTNCGTDVRDLASTAPAALDDAGVAKLTRLLREQTAGEYEIERELARGGMGVVYLATEIQLRRRVAIKVLPPALTFGAGAIERFRREARTAAALDHPNIIPIYRVGGGGDLLWYSMKLLEGKTLDTILKEHERLSFEETIAILDQVGDALDYAHQHGVIHRDVKPGNIFLDDRGRVTVTDFGIAKEIQEPSVSASGHLLGTPRYMSPEHYRGAEISGAADQYSLGVVAFQSLGGRVPFDAPTAYELLNKHASEPPPPLAELRPDLPSHSYVAIDRALAKKPEDRFATVTQFVRTLAGRIPAAPRRSRRGAWVAGITAAGIALYGVVTVVRRAPEDDALRVAPGPTAGRDSIQRESAPRIRAGPTTQAPMAVLVIRLANGWARIYVDGALRGERPVHREELPPGTHTLRFERPDFVALDTTLTLQTGVNVLEIEMRRITP
jgi:predicted Ser/Thr protein kinase